MLDAFQNDPEHGKTLATSLFPICDETFFGTAEYDEDFLVNLTKLRLFLRTILSFPEANDAIFTYNPWW